MTRNVYTNMLKINSKKVAADFLANELKFIEKTLSDMEKNTTVVVVGCHEGMYFENITRRCFNYIGIDPYADNQHSPHILQMTFETYAQQRKLINKEKSIFIFWFNVLSHIDITLINDCFIDGDIIINSLWGGEVQDIKLRNEYYSTFNDDSKQYQKILQAAQKTHSLNDIKVPFSSIDYFYNSPNFFELACV